MRLTEGYLVTAHWNHTSLPHFFAAVRLEFLEAVVAFHSGDPEEALLKLQQARNKLSLLQARAPLSSP